jgi:hypothetical protein
MEVQQAWIRTSFESKRSKSTTSKAKKSITRNRMMDFDTI